ncbi:hypothetical protein [Chitinimonas koreensis]|uniref:hypothetical protein n=1 Tax=Chitinimonas koreensis TaxID=356302 RepID=UPI0003F6CEC3|nr:hypothetical protein [Chitinimonas koreensis]QNM94779.1 hypothetical protein H9L41_12605 [Chitinimonas koreensis]
MSLHCELHAAAELDAGLRAAMYAVFERHYAATTPERFAADLAGKDRVLLLRDAAGTVQGFSTLQLQQLEHQGVACRVLYSGDTVVARAHWGEQELAFSWLRLAGALQAERPELRHYWFLISKGHRTYRYLPAFARRFLPHWSQGADGFEAGLLARLAAERFGAAYDPAAGVVRFAASQGHLRAELAEVDDRERRLDAVRFFLERNPGYARGDELCCLCALEPANLRPLARRVFERGMAAAEAPCPA